jgi:hypothetical protein
MDMSAIITVIGKIARQPERFPIRFVMLSSCIRICLLREGETCDSVAAGPQIWLPSFNADRQPNGLVMFIHPESIQSAGFVFLCTS